MEAALDDRITESKFVQIGTEWWQQGGQSVYAEDDGTPTSAGIRRTRVTGLGASSGYGILTGESVSVDIHGNETVQKFYLDRTAKTLTRTYEDRGIKGRPTGFKLGDADDPEYAVTYGYDASNGRFDSVSWSAGAENGVVNYSYVPNSELLAGYSSDNGIGVSYSYEDRRNLKNAVENTYGVSVISRYAYRYDELGRRTDVVNTGTAFAQNALSKYGYNDRSEVTSSERYQGDNPDAPGTAVTAENRTYDYDPIGNRKASIGWNDAAGAQQNLIYTSNVLNQYTSVTEGGAAVASPDYDDDGNMTEYKDKACTWNAENRLISVETGDKKVEFLYDYMGRRVRKQVYAGSPGDWSLESEMQFVYDGWNLVKEIAVSGAGSDKYFVWGPDLSRSLQGAGGIGGLLCSVDGGSVRYFLYDGNGNVGQLVDAGGVIAAHYEYDAFGNAVKADGDYAEGNSFRFSTKYWDDETGFGYWGKRYYFSELGRWLSRDPIGERGGYNLYGFVGNSFINRIDAFGLETYVLFYYSRSSQPAFKRAAETMKQNIESRNYFNPACDKIILKGVFTAKDLEAEWKATKKETDGNDTLKIKEVRIFTHAGPGKLYLKKSSLNAKQIKALPILNWNSEGKIICHGCETGEQPKSGGDSVAGSFESGQGVRAQGQTGYAQFSEKPDRRGLFDRIDDESKSVYLWSFGDGGKEYTFGDSRPLSSTPEPTFGR